MERVLALGGGGFLMEDGRSAIDEYLLELAHRDRPRICFVPTPSGDLPEHLEKFYAAYTPALCEPTHLSFFRKPSENSVAPAGLEEHILSRDIVFVGGGNTKSALGVWREWGLDAVLGRALKAGVILSGMSAGAMCWFELGLTDSFWGPELQPLRCLGFLPGSCGVHYGSDSKRRPALHAALKSGTVSRAVAIDDYAAVLYRDGQVERVLSWSSGATAYSVTISDGNVDESAYEAQNIARRGANS